MRGSEMKLIPTRDGVIVKRVERSNKVGSLYLPDSAQEEPQFGTVESTGPGKPLDNGQVRPMTVKKGDKVLFGKYSGNKVKMGEEEFLFMREEDIMAIVEE